MRLEERNQQGASAEVHVRNYQDRNKGSGSEMDSKGQTGKIIKGERAWSPSSGDEDQGNP